MQGGEAVGKATVDWERLSDDIIGCKRGLLFKRQMDVKALHDNRNSTK